MFSTSQKTEQLYEELKTSFDLQHCGLVFSIGEKNTIDITRLIAHLNADGINFVGGYFPYLINEDQILDDGIIVQSFPKFSEVFHIKDCNEDIQGLTKDLNANEENIFLLYDYNTLDIENILDYINYNSENLFKGIGAGAGSKTNGTKPSIFSNNGFVDKGVLCFRFQQKTSYALEGGWSKLGSTALVTKVNGNKIMHINWASAKDFYSEALSKYKTVNEANINKFCKDFPIGILDNLGDCKVRDVIEINQDGSLLLAEGLKENTNIELLHGCKISLLKAAEKCISKGFSKLDQLNQNYTVSCVGRFLYDPEYFMEELHLLNNICKARGIKNEGILSLGEIITNEENQFEYHNKSIAVIAR